MASVSEQKPWSQVGPPALIQKQSAFLRLPPEIRNMVYELIFQGEVTNIPSYSKIRETGKIRAPALLRTCKQVHYEALAMYYSLAMFFFSRITTNGAKRWIEAIGHARIALVSSACFPSLYFRWSSERSFDGHAQVSADYAHRFLKHAKKELEPLAGALKMQVEVVERVRIPTNSPLQLVKDVLEVSQFKPRYGRFWISEPSDELKRLFPSWMTNQDVEKEERKRKMAIIRRRKERTLKTKEKVLKEAELDKLYGAACIPWAKRERDEARANLRAAEAAEKELL